MGAVFLDVLQTKRSFHASIWPHGAFQSSSKLTIATRNGDRICDSN